MAALLPLKKWIGANNYLLPICSGLMLIPAFPRFEQGYLAWFALLPLLVFCISNPPRKAAAGGFLFGLLIALYLNFYLITLLYNYLSLPLAIFSAAALITLISLYSALFAAGVSCLRETCSPFVLTLAIPSLWVVLEYIRSLGFMGYNVGYLGYTQWRYPWLLNTAATYGYWGLPFIMIAFQCFPVLAWKGQLSGRRLAAAAAVWLVLFGGGMLLPFSFDQEQPLCSPWTALIQGNSSPEEVLRTTGKDQILRRYMDLTRRAAAEQPGINLVVWPETVVDLEGPNIFHKPEMIDLARELQANLLYGARISHDSKLYNSIVALPAGGDGITLYHKCRLVPFVEYSPAEKLLNLIVNLDLRVGGYTAGEKKTTLFNLANTPVAGVICFESYFGDYTRRFARDGARHLFVLTNDAWFENSTSLEHHAQVAAIRAAENGIGVTQVANSGITVSFDYRGREVLRLPKLTEKYAVMPLNTGSRRTLYRRFGDFLPAFCGLFLAGLAATLLARRIKARTGL